MNPASTAQPVRAEAEDAAEALSTTVRSEEGTAGGASAASGTAADRFMRRLLRVNGVPATPRTAREAHRGFRVSLVVSGFRCIVMYLAVPILVPILGFSGAVAAPIGILLAVIAGVNGVYSVRRFWIGNLGSRWMYTWFIAFVFLVLIVGLVIDVSKIVGAL